jgi:hypothetical protein
MVSNQGCDAAIHRDVGQIGAVWRVQYPLLPKPEVLSGFCPKNI